MFRPSRYRHFAVAAVLAALVAAAPAVAFAQTRYPDVPVLVAGEDEGAQQHGLYCGSGPWIVPRSHGIFQRVIAEIKGVASRAGFRVIDEAAVAVDLDWKIRDGRPKMDLIDLAKMMNRSADATHGVRALVLFSIHVTPNCLWALHKFQIRMKGEIYDLASNQFVDTVEKQQEYAERPGCLDDPGCISGVVGGRAREVAATLGDGLAAKLARYRKASAGGTAPGTVTTAKPADRGHGIQTPYTVTFEYFDRREAVTIIAVMADEFPGYKSHRLMRTDQAVRKYAYITTAKPAKMEEWLTILLADMNFDPDKEIRIAIDGTDITVEKIVPTPDRPRSADEKAIFK